MKTFNQYVQEHNPLAVKSIVKKINPLDKQMAKLKRMRKRGVTGAVKDALVKSIIGKRPKSGEVKQWKDKNADLSKEIAKQEKEIKKLKDQKLDTETLEYILLVFSLSIITKGETTPFLTSLLASFKVS